MNLDISGEFAKRHGRIQHPVAFFLLCFFTFGLYAIWWQYKVWCFFKEKDGLTIYPAARAFFTVFFIHALMDRLDYEAREKGHEGIYASTYATLYVVISLIARILDKLTPEISLLALFIPAYIFLIPSLKQYNFYWEQETSYAVPRTMSSGAIVTLIFGVLVFLVVLLGLMQPS